MSLADLAGEQNDIGLFGAVYQHSSESADLLRSLDVIANSSVLEIPLVAAVYSELPGARACEPGPTFTRGRDGPRGPRTASDRMGPEASLEQLDRWRMCDLEEARGLLLTARGRSSEALPIFEANVRRWEQYSRQAPDEWLMLLYLLKARKTLVEARLESHDLCRRSDFCFPRRVIRDGGGRRHARPAVNTRRARRNSSSARRLTLRERQARGRGIHVKTGLVGDGASRRLSPTPNDLAGSLLRARSGRLASLANLSADRS